MWSRSRSGPLRSGSNKIIMALGGSGSATLLFFSIQITLRPLYFLCRVHVVVVSFSHCKTNSPLLLYDRNPLPDSKRPIFATSDTTPPPPHPCTVGKICWNTFNQYYLLLRSRSRGLLFLEPEPAQPKHCFFITKKWLKLSQTETKLAIKIFSFPVTSLGKTKLPVIKNCFKA